MRTGGHWSKTEDSEERSYSGRHNYIIVLPPSPVNQGSMRKREIKRESLDNLGI